jgi:surface antigen
MVLDVPASGNVTRSEPPAALRASAINDEVAESKTAASPLPASGRTEPVGFCVKTGETAALAGEIVGGGLAAGFDEHDRQATVVTSARTL